MLEAHDAAVVSGNGCSIRLKHCSVRRVYQKTGTGLPCFTILLMEVERSVSVQGKLRVFSVMTKAILWTRINACYLFLFRVAAGCLFY